MKAHNRRKGWRAFLTPGWFLSLLAVLVFSYFAFTFLAPWQLGKDDALVHRNEQIERAFKEDPIPYEEVMGTEHQLPAEKEWTRVAIRGHYLPDSEVLLRLRPVEANPAFQSLVPFQSDQGAIILINRGYEPPIEGATPPIPKAPAETTTVVGVLRADEQKPKTQPMEDGGYHQVYGINTEEISQVTGQDLVDAWVQLSPDQPGSLRPIPIPKLDRGSHLSYGLQWIAFGIMAPLGLGYFIYSELRERRRVREEEAEVQAEATEATEEQTAEEETPEETPTPETRSRDVRSRYGGQHPDHFSKLGRRKRERF